MVDALEAAALQSSAGSDHVDEEESEDEELPPTPAPRVNLVVEETHGKIRGCCVGSSVEGGTGVCARGEDVVVMVWSTDPPFFSHPLAEAPRSICPDLVTRFDAALTEGELYLNEGSR